MKGWNERPLILFFSFAFLLGAIFILEVFHAYQREISLLHVLTNWPLLKGGIDHEVLMTLRLPRFFSAFLAGSSLSLAGLLVQRAANNPLASPTVLGINSTASLFVSLYLTLVQSSLTSGIFASAALGAFVGGLALFSLAYWTNALFLPERLILVGVALGLLNSSLTQVVLLFDENNMQGLLYWLLGGVEGKNWIHVQILLACCSIGFLGCLILQKSLVALKLGDDLARSLGHRPFLTRLGSFALTVLLVAGAVSTCGPIGFVGLIVPNICQKIWPDRQTIPFHFTALAGGIFLAGADFISRLVHYPYETPVGILSGLMGSLYFLFLIIFPPGTFSSFLSLGKMKKLET